MKKRINSVLFICLVAFTIKAEFQYLADPLPGISYPAPGYRENTESMRKKTIGFVEDEPFLTYAQKQRLYAEELQYKKYASLVNMPQNTQYRVNIEPVILTGNRNAMNNQKQIGLMEKPIISPMGTTTFTGQTGIYNRGYAFKPKEGLPLR